MFDGLIDVLGHTAWLQMAIAIWVATSLAGVGTVILFRSGGPRGQETLGEVFKLSSWPGSHCPHCQNKLNPLDRTPLLGFVMAGGHCRHCKIQIPWKYPLLEIVFAAPILIATWAGLGGPLGLLPIGASLTYPFLFMAIRGVKAAGFISLIIGLGLLLTGLYFEAWQIIMLTSLYFAGALSSLPKKLNLNILA